MKTQGREAETDVDGVTVEAGRWAVQVTDRNWQFPCHKVVGVPGWTGHKTRGGHPQPGDPLWNRTPLGSYFISTILRVWLKSPACRW